MSEVAAGYNVAYMSTQAFLRAIKSEVTRLKSVRATDYSGPDPSLIRALFQETGWTQTHGSDLLKVDVSTLRRWMADREQKQSREIPYTAWALLLLESGNASLDSLRQQE